MKLSDVFDALAYGELSALHMAQDGEISPEHVNRLLIHINHGLLDLHKRFMLKRKYLTVQTQADKSRYVLDAKYTHSEGSQLDLPYIMDEGDPFKNDLIEVIRVTDSKGVDYSLDGRHKGVAVKTPQGGETPSVVLSAYNILRFTSDVGEQDFLIEYQAGHEHIPRVVNFDTFDASKVDIDLPMTHLEALSFYVAARVITPLANNLGNPNEGMNYASMYEAACQELGMQGLDVSSTVDGGRFSRSGFV